MVIYVADSRYKCSCKSTKQVNSFALCFINTKMDLKVVFLLENDLHMIIFIKLDDGTILLLNITNNCNLKFWSRKFFQMHFRDQITL